MVELQCNNNQKCDLWFTVSGLPENLHFPDGFLLSQIERLKRLMNFQILYKFISFNSKVFQFQPPCSNFEQCLFICLKKVVPLCSIAEFNVQSKNEFDSKKDVVKIDEKFSWSSISEEPEKYLIRRKEINVQKTDKKKNIFDEHYLNSYFQSLNQKKEEVKEPILVKITKFRRYGSGLMYEFECQFAESECRGSSKITSIRKYTELLLNKKFTDILLKKYKWLPSENKSLFEEDVNFIQDLSDFNLTSDDIKSLTDMGQQINETSTAPWRDIETKKLLHPKRKKDKETVSTEPKNKRQKKEPAENSVSWSI